RVAHRSQTHCEMRRGGLDALAAAGRNYALRFALGGVRKELNAKLAAMAAAVRELLLRRRSRLERLTSQMEALSPVAILDRGYALVFDASGKLVKDAASVKSGEEIRARVARGEIVADVKRTSG